MTKSIANQFVNLEKEYESLKNSLVDIDSSIKKVTGKDPSRFIEDGKPRGRKFRNPGNGENFRRFAGTKRRLGEFGDDEDDFPTKRTLQSQVETTSWEPKHRDQVLEEQKKDKKSLQRNKRMFGLIMKTLETFKNEESHRPDLKKRAEIENKLDQADKQEREAVKQEREQLFRMRKEKRLKLKCLEEKLQRAELHKEWEKSQQSIGNFIETKTKPHIFYMPLKMNHETTKRLQETKDKYRIILAEKRAKVQKELNDIEQSFKLENDVEEETKVVIKTIRQPSPELKESDNRRVENGSSESNQDSKEQSSRKEESKENGKKVKEEIEDDKKVTEEIEDKDFEPIYD